MIDKTLKEINLSILQVGDIGLVHDDFVWNDWQTYAPLLIQGYTNCYYHHSFIISKNTYGELVFNEPFYDGVNSRTYEKGLLDRQVKIIRHPSLVGLTPEREHYLINRANSKIGFPYDYTTCFVYQPIYLLSKHFIRNGIWLGPTGVDAAKCFYCSEYCAWVMELLDWWKFIPKDFYINTIYLSIFEGKIIKVKI